MALSIPDQLEIQYRWDSKVRGLYKKNQSVVFTQPEELRSHICDNIHEASCLLKNTGITYPYMDWEVVHPDNNFWTVWKYEMYTHPKSSHYDTQEPLCPPTSETKAYDLYFTNGTPPLSAQEPSKFPPKLDTREMETETSGEDLIESLCVREPTTPPTNPYTREADLWDSTLVSKWIDRPQPSPEDDLILTKITHFRRYGLGCCFEFLCTFKPQGTASRHKPRAWLKFTDLIKVPLYSKLLKKEKWNVRLEKNRNWEEEDGILIQSDDEWSEDEYYSIPKEGRKAIESWKKYRDEDKKTNPKKRKRSSDSEADDEDKKDDQVSDSFNMSDSESVGDSESHSSDSDEKLEKARVLLQKSKKRRSKHRSKRQSKWDPIFRQSSMDQTPSYKIKPMKPSE